MEYILAIILFLFAFFVLFTCVLSSEDTSDDEYDEEPLHYHECCAPATHPVGETVPDVYPLETCKNRSRCNCLSRKNDPTSKPRVIPKGGTNCGEHQAGCEYRCCRCHHCPECASGSLPTDKIVPLVSFSGYDRVRPPINGRRISFNKN